MTHEITSHYSSLDIHAEDDSKYQCEECGIKQVRYPDGSLKLRNPTIQRIEEDFLYHLGLSSTQHDLEDMFAGVKFICLGATPERMKAFAQMMITELKIKLPASCTLNDLGKTGHRYGLYKVGPIISVSHGVGMPCIGILLHELIKLMYHAKIKDPIFIKMGTSGGLGLEPGSVVVSEECWDGMGNNYYSLPVLGEMKRRPAILDKTFAKELIMTCEPDTDGFVVTSGITLSTNDFYEGEGRLDGAFAFHREQEKIRHLYELHERGVRNIEMEGLAFAAFTYLAGIKAAVVSVTILDRLQGDQVNTPKGMLVEFQNRPQFIVARYIKRYCSVRNLTFLN